MKKRILLVSPYFPYPPHDGGKVRMYNLIRHLAAENELYLLSYIETLNAREYAPALEMFCKKVYTVLRDENKRIMGEDLPRSISFFYTPEMIEALERTLAEVKPDIVQIDFLIMTQYVNHLGGIPAVYTEHDMSNINFEQSFHDRDLPEKERFVEWNKLVQFEKKILGKFAAAIVLTERDKKILEGFLPGTRSALVPTGVDIHRYRPNEKEAAAPTLVYVGHYRHYPNYDAVQYFLKDIFPLIAKEKPETRFLIVGSGVTREMLALGSDRVTITGEVEDVGKYLGQATVFVAPVRLGGGIKGKVLEAMASGLPVVATREASEGIQCRDGEHVLVAESAADFAAKTLALLEDRQLREKLAAAGRRLVEEEYDWRRIAGTLDSLYGTLLQRR